MLHIIRRLACFLALLAGRLAAADNLGQPLLIVSTPPLEHRAWGSLLLQTLAIALPLLALILQAIRLYGHKRRADSLEEFHWRTLHSIGEAVITTDDAGRILMMNAPAEQLTGYTFSEAHGQPIGTIVQLRAPDGTPTPYPLPEVLAQIATSQDIALASTLQSRSGSQHHIAGSLAAIRPAQGKPLGTVMIFRDMTEENRQHDESKRRLELLKTASEMGALDFFVHYLEPEYQHLSIPVNADFWPQEDARPIAPDRYLLPEDYPDFNCQWQLLRQGKWESIDCEYRTRHHDRLRWFHLKAYRQTDYSGHQVLLGIMQDITEIRLSESHEREKNHMLQEIFARSEVCVFAKDYDDGGRYLGANASLAALCQVAPDAVLGKTAAELFPAETAAAIQAVDDQTVAQEQRTSCCLAISWPGATRHYQISKSFYLRPDGHRIIVGVALDISSLKHLEQEQADGIITLNRSLRNERLHRKCLAHIAATMDFDQAMAAILEEVGRDFAADRAFVFRFDPDRTTLTHTHNWQSDPQADPGIFEADYPADFFAPWLQELQQRQVVVIEASQPVPPALHAWMQARQIQGVAVAGVWYKDQLYGLTGLDFTRQRPEIFANDRELLTGTASIIALALERCEQQKQQEQSLVALQQANQTLQNLLKSAAVNRKCLELLTAQTDTEAAFSAIATLVGDWLEADTCAIFEDSSRVFRARAYWHKLEGQPPPRHIPKEAARAILHYLESGQTLAGYRSGTSELPEPVQHEVNRYLHVLNMSSLCCRCITVDGNPWGYLGFVRQQERRISLEEFDLLQGVVRTLEIYLGREAIRLRQVAESNLKNTIFEAAPVPLLLFNPDHSIAMCNEQARQIISQPRETILRTTCQRLFCQSEQVPESCPVSRTLRSGEPVTVTMQLHGRQYNITTQPVFAEGKIINVLQAMVDQTELLESEEHYRDVSQMLSNLLENLPCQVFVKDYSAGGNYLIANRALHDMYAFAPGSMIGRNDLELFDAARAQQFQAEDKQALSRGSHEFSETLALASGNRQLQTSKIRVSRAGGQDLLLGICFDVTEIHQSKLALVARSQELQQTNLTLEAFLAQSGIMRRCTEQLVGNIDSHQALETLLRETGVFLGAEFCAVVKIEEGQLHPEAAWYADDEVPRITPNSTVDSAALLEELGRHNQVGAIRGRPGSEPRQDALFAHYLEQAGAGAVLVTGVNFAGTLWGCIGFHRQSQAPFIEPELHTMQETARVVEIILIRKGLMDELRQKEEALSHALQDAQAAVRAKTLFLATMSHEIRTPLNAVIGFSDFLENHPLRPEEQKEYLAGIRLSSHALLKLINDILDLSKLEAGKMDLATSLCRLPDLLHEIHAIFSQRARVNALDFSVSCPETMPLLNLNEQRLRQILLNVVGNAIKFTDKGYVSCEALFTPADATHGALAIRIADSGMGMDRKVLQHLFDPFSQPEQIRSGKVLEGTGLGLSIAKRLLERMDGDITCTSEPGTGTCFTITLHAVAYAAHHHTASLAAVATDSAPTGLPFHSALLVDDVLINMKVLAGYLKKFDVASRLASSGQEALAMLRQEPADLVLTDLWMPEMNGVDLAGKIRLLPGLAGLPVILVTADIEPQASFDCSHFNAILYKPMSQEKIAAALRKAAGG